MNLGRTVQPESVQRILNALSNNLTPKENLAAKVLGPITTPGANVEFTVSHNLGTVPDNYIWNVDSACMVYDSRRVNWTTSQMFLKCSAAGATLYLLVM
jgi:hypothetical protein